MVDVDYDYDHGPLLHFCAMIFKHPVLRLRLLLLPSLLLSPPPSCPEKNKTVRSCIIHARERCKKLSERIAATSSLKENAPPRLGSTSKQPPASLAALRLRECKRHFHGCCLCRRYCDLRSRLNYSKEGFSKYWCRCRKYAMSGFCFLLRHYSLMMRIASERSVACGNICKHQASYPQFSRISDTWMHQAKKCTCKKIGREKCPPGKK